MVLTRKKVMKMNVMIIGVYLFLYCSYIFLVNGTSYIGIRAAYKGDIWKIQRIFAGGIAEKLDIKQGSEIYKINRKLPEENYILNKWLVLEQAESIEIKNEGKIKKINLESENVNFKIISYIFIVILILHILLWTITREGFNCKKMEWFYYFCITILIFLLSIYPSSLGVTLARMIVIASISIIPILFAKILVYFLGVDKINKLKGYFKLLYSIAIINIIIAILNLVFVLPIIFIEYLSMGPIAYVIFSLVYSTYIFSNNCNLNNNDSISFKGKILYLIISCLIPLIIFYLIPFESKTSFLVLLVFIGSIALILIYMLILSKAIRLKKTKYVRKAFKVAIIIYFTIITVAIIVMSKDISLPILIIFILFEYYPILTLIIEITKVFDKIENSSKSINIFNAEEHEREEISNYIHDTIIQDIIYYSLKINDDNAGVRKDQVLNLLDDVIYSLRELCSEIYPIMIEEIGLVKTLDHVISELMKKHPVNINFITIKFDESKFSNEENNFIFRSVRELINNSIKHGKATSIKVTFYEENENNIFIVSDNGKYVNSENIKTLNFGVNSIKNKLKLINGSLKYSFENGTKAMIKIDRECEI